MSLTGLHTKSPAQLTRPALLLRGLDSLYVSFYLNVASSALDWEELGYQKERVRAREADLAPLALGSERFALMPYGKNPYRYVLVNRAFEVRLAERLSPSCHVQFFSEALWEHGLEALLARFRAWCESLRLVAAKPETVSRADWAFDYHLPAIDFDADCFVSRAAKDAAHREHRAAQTFRFGQGEVVVRIYDKVAEIAQQSGKAWFFQLWERQDQVWRIEFQVRGERLKQAGIRSLDDLRSLQNDLLRELAESHTTLRRPTKDSNRARWPLHSLWRALQADIAALPQTGLVRSIDPAAALQWRLYRQTRSLYGSLKGIAAVSSLIQERDEPISLEELLARLDELVQEHHAPSLWREDVQQRITAHGFGQW